VTLASLAVLVPDSVLLALSAKAMENSKSMLIHASVVVPVQADVLLAPFLKNSQGEVKGCHIKL
jgi:hypothetical protein